MVTVTATPNTFVFTGFETNVPNGLDWFVEGATNGEDFVNTFVEANAVLLAASGWFWANGAAPNCDWEADVGVLKGDWVESVEFDTPKTLTELVVDVGKPKLFVVWVKVLPAPNVLVVIDGAVVANTEFAENF